MNKTFVDLARDLMTTYGECLDLSDQSKWDLFGDLIEIWEDFERLHPILTDMLKCTMTSEEFRKGLLKLETWSWHTADHFTSLGDTLKNEGATPCF